MAKTVVTTTEYTDDLDGGRADRTVTFSWDGANYEIDLSKKNAGAFDKAIAPYVTAARRVRGVRRVAARPPRGNSGLDLGAVRSWAAEQGYEVSARGRIASDVLEAYKSAH